MIETKHNCKLSCDICTKVFFEGPMQVDDSGYVPVPDTNLLDISQGKSRRRFMVCDKCYGKARDAVGGAMPDTGLDTSKTFSVRLMPVGKE